jgi:8-oxo-dGTP pyrophosphatase MutT (NUDIX family)
MKRVTPKLSASLLIVDNTENEPRFLFGRRHNNHVFMPNRYVFPGGKVDASDRAVSAHAPMHEADRLIIEAHLNARHSAKGAIALALCAIREAWEEAGLLIGQTNHFEASHRHWQSFVDNNMAPDPSALRLLGRAITPATYARRYDAWFFMAFRSSVILSVDICGPDSELVHQVWASEAETAAFDLPSITRAILREAVIRLESDPDLIKDTPVPMFFTRSEKTSRKVLGI